MFLSVIFSQILSLASTIFVIWMIVDCVRNPAVVRKAVWIIFILVTQFIGAAVYFFVHGPWPKVRQYLFSQRSLPRYQTPYAPDSQAFVAPQPAQEPFSDYERGYQAQQQDRAPLFQEYEPPEDAPLPPEYQQSLVTYPEPPQMEQPQ